MLNIENIAILVQARMSSERCPGKVMADLNGAPLLQRLLESLEQNESGLQVIICTSLEESDDCIAEFCSKRKTSCFRGNLNDVAKRFMDTCAHYQLNHLVRISGDSPWFNVSLVNQAIKDYNASKAQICCNIYPRSFPKGQSIEVFSSQLLETYYTRMNFEDREHVTSVFYRYKHELSFYNIARHPRINHLDLSIDTPQQLKQCQKIFMGLERDHWQYSIDEVLALYDKNLSI